MKYGYARVSSNGQDYDGQVEALKAAGCERVHCDKASGKSIDGRREFDKLMKALVPGDAVVVTKLDRLARSSRDLQNILHELEARSCGFLSLGESWCDTTTDVGRLMLTIMGGIAEFEIDPETMRRGHCEGKAQGDEVRPAGCIGCQPKADDCRSLHKGRDDGRSGARVRMRHRYDLEGDQRPFRGRRRKRVKLTKM